MPDLTSNDFNKDNTIVKPEKGSQDMGREDYVFVIYTKTSAQWRMFLYNHLCLRTTSGRCSACPTWDWWAGRCMPCVVRTPRGRN